MNTIGLGYGKWLGNMEWNYVATIRPHYKLNEFNSDKKMEGLFKYKNVDYLFFALEKDRKGCSLNHIHLMLKSNTSLSRKQLASAIGVNPKAVGFFKEVGNAEAISYYSTKNISKTAIHHNFFI